MTDTSDTQNGQGASRLWANKHALTFAVGGVALSGASIWFNGNFGYGQGGLAMTAALIGFAVAKDGGISYAWASRGKTGRVAAGLVGAIGFAISCMAALGASSHGRQEAANPLQAQIEAYETATKTAADLEARLKPLGAMSVGQAEAALANVKIDASIFKRTNGCTELEHRKSRIAAVNREACSKLQAAQAMVTAAKEAGELNAKLEDARAIIAKGRPASSDAQASTIATLLGLDKIDSIQAVLNITLALAIEIIAPLCWAAYASATMERPAPEAPAKPAQAAVRRRAARQDGKLSDDEVEAMMLLDIARGVERTLDEYSDITGKSVATLSRMLDRLTTKPDAKLASKKVGTRRVLYAVK